MPKRSSPPPGSDKYRQNHQAVYKARGKAKNQKCVDCGKQAAEWSTIHGTDGSNPHSHYEPRCNKCHAKYDGVAERVSKWGKGRTPSEESNRKRSEKLSGRTLSDEHRSKISKATQGRKVPFTQTDEYRDKMSKALKDRVFSEEHKRKLREAMERRKTKGGDPS